MAMITNPREAAWLAGLIDGEGSIGLGWVTTNRKKGKKHLRPGIQIAMSHLGCMDEVARLTDQKVYVYKPYKESYRDQGNIFIGGMKKILKILVAVYPYLHCKKKQAELLILYIGSRLRFRDRSWEYWGYTDYELEIYEELRKLNKRGKLDP